MKRLTQHWFKLVTLLLLMIIVAAVAMQLNGVGKPSKLKSIKQAADFQLSSLDGENVSLPSTAGTARLIYFFYKSCPDACYPHTLLLSKGQDMLKEKKEFPSQASILSITFDPKRDNVEKLQSFAAQ